MYDFSGEPGTAELSITAGEILTVTRDNVGDGWCEGFNSMGQSGLFPAAYVQIIEPTGATTSATVSSLSSVQQSSGDYWDDDWDDDSEVGQTPAYNPQQQSQQYSNLDDISGPISNNFISPPAAHALPALPEKTVSNVPKKNNKFSTLIKSGEEGFLMGTKVLPIPEDEKIFVQETEDGRCYWLPTGEEYKCVVTSPKKGSKLKGLKSFIVYQLTPTVIIFYYY